MKTCLAILVTFSLVFIGCSEGSPQEVYQNRRDKLVDVQKQIKEINTGDLLIGRYNQVYTVGDNLLITAGQTDLHHLFVFDKSNFAHQFSALPRGEGPRELTSFGSTLAINKDEKKIYATDHGKWKIFSYDLDSLADSPKDYEPIVVSQMTAKEFPAEFQYVNEHLSFSRTIRPTGNSGFTQVYTQWNMKTGEMKPLSYTHPQIQKKRSVFFASRENNIGIECYHHHDLITIHHLDGGLKYNIYGPQWNDQSTNEYQYYTVTPLVVNNHIVIASSQGVSQKKTRDIRPQILLIFDLDGNYIKTIDIGYQIYSICYDADTDRLFFAFDDVIQFGYLDLEGLI